MAQPTIFISYSHKNEAEKDQLVTHLGVLAKQGLVELWVDDQIGPGSDWKQEINQKIAQAKVAILLITADFLTSDFILNQEVPQLLQRHQRDGLVIVPLIAKPCAWKKVDWLGQLHVRPKNGRPVWSDGGSHAEEDLAAIANEVGDILQRGLGPEPNGPIIIPPSRLTKMIVIGVVIGVIILIGLSAIQFWPINNVDTNRPSSSQSLPGPTAVAIDTPTGTASATPTATVVATPTPTPTLTSLMQTLIITISSERFGDTELSVTASSSAPKLIPVKGDEEVTVSVQVLDQNEAVIPSAKFDFHWELCCQDKRTRPPQNSQTPVWQFQPPTDLLTETLTIRISDDIGHSITATLPFSITDY